MKTNIFSQIRKKGIGHTVLGVFMMLSLVLQNATYVQYAYAHTEEDNAVTSTSSNVEESHDSTVSHESEDKEDVVIEIRSESDTHTASEGEETHQGGDDAKVGDVDRDSDDKVGSDEVKDSNHSHDGDDKKGGDRDHDDVGTIKDIFHDINGSKPAVTVVATKIVCDQESKLPNWGLGGPDITATTATAYVATHAGCTLTPDWNFQWGYSSVRDLSGSFIGAADGSMGSGSNTGTGLTDWKTFGTTNADGVASTKIYDLQGSPKIWVREVMKDGYVPFSYDPSHPVNDNNVSAELYCNSDVLNYDNYDYIGNPVLGNTYYCVAFNAAKSVVHTNQAPVITVVGANPATTTLDAVFVDLGSTVFDTEDGNITNKLVATGTVNTHVLGTYTITYNATDSQNLAAATKTRTVNVVPATGCTSNCGTASNTPPVITVVGLNPLTLIQNTVFADPGATAFDLEDGTVTPVATGTVNTGVLGTYTITYTATDSQGATATPKTRTVNVVPVGTPINQKPEITLLGNVVMQLVVGTTFTDPSATVADLEDGNITNKLVATGTVDTNTIGSYTITYNATDSQNLAADTKTRTVNIVAASTGCTSNCGGSGTSEYPGCTNPAATNYNRLANKDDGSCSYPGGGGGGGSTPLTISNEKLAVTGTTSVTVTWNTNLPSDSRVVYGMASVPTLAAKPSYGYPLTTATDTTNVYNHLMVINGIPSAIATYYRPVSSINSEIVTGIELTRTPDATGGSTGGSCEYLKEYMRLGVNNNPSEVTKLQLFLKNYDDAKDLQVTGFFDITTDKAVRSFQDKYKKDVLEAWNLPSNTGYVYYTTKKKINEIYCQREFPLTLDQKAEIVSFRALIERVNAINSNVGSDILPLVGTNKTQGSGSAGSVAGASTVKTTPVTVSVTPDYAALDANAKKDTTGDTAKPENRGRIAIADLLATAPSIAEDVTAGSVTSEAEDMYNGTATDEGVVAGTSTKRSMLASVAASLTSRFNQCSPATIYFTLIFLVLALIFATLYFRKPKVEGVVEAEVVTKE